MNALSLRTPPAEQEPHCPAEPTSQHSEQEPHCPAEPTSQHSELGRRSSSDWYTDTLHTIVARALDSDKPDIKGALAALAMLAETEDAAPAGEDVARLIRDARRRVADAQERTDPQR